MGCCALFLSFFCSVTLHAQQDVTVTDSVVTMQQEKPKTDNFMKRWWRGLIYGNVDRTFEKAMDWSIAFAPSYSREGSVGIGGMASALYRLDKTDSIMQPSDVSLSGSISLKGFYVLLITGNTNFKGNKNRLSYKLYFTNKNLDFWGISYDDCVLNPVSQYKRQQLKLDIDYVYKVMPDLHIGALVGLNYTNAKEIANIEYLQGQQRSYLLGGVGLSLQYDTRDFIQNPKRGLYARIQEVCYPAFMGNYNKTIFSTTAIFNAYTPMWKGFVLAYDLYGQFKSANTPWVLREELGSGGSRMRGYYGGRYIDANFAATQLELRQHIYGRIGCNVWVGTGAVFPSFNKLGWNNLLPNYGLGFRFEFKHNVNLRIDYGFGKNTSGIVCQIAEAF